MVDTRNGYPTRDLFADYAAIDSHSTLVKPLGVFGGVRFPVHC